MKVIDLSTVSPAAQRAYLELDADRRRWTLPELVGAERAWREARAQHRTHLLGMAVDLLLILIAMRRDR